jgi:sortase A
MLGYAAFVLADAWIFQKRANLELERRHEQPAAHSAGSPAERPAGLIGRIEIPRIGLAAVIAEGIDSTTLRRAAGHIPDTALPGQPGNVGIAGHRDSFFRPLRNIRKDDLITLTTALGEYRYRVLSARVVGPTDVSVLYPTGDSILTLVTCYPFYFVGAAPNRFIVRAELADH